MPNWTHNHVTITGATEDIAHFKQTCLVGGVLDFNTVIPMPEEMRASLSLSGAEEMLATLSLSGDVGLSGMPDWYRWSCDNWGTKWNACDFGCREEKDGSFVCSFDTAWAPPVPVFEKLGNMFPDLDFKITGYCVESDSAFEGSIKSGQLELRKSR